MDGKRSVQIRSDVTLAPLEARHAATMYGWMLNPEVRENIGLRSEPTLEKTNAWIENAGRDASVLGAFAIQLAGAHVGNVVLDRHDAHASTARLSIYVGEKIARGRGIGRSAVFLAAREGLVSRGLHKIWLIVHAQNAAAIKTYTSLGFVQEGVLRDEFLLDGRRLPALYMGLLKPEFEQLDAVRVQA